VRQSILSNNIYFLVFEDKDRKKNTLLCKDKTKKNI
jgi:hypothetical protein